MIAIHDNGYTRGFRIGKFGGLFYMHVYYGLRANFRWHIHAQIDYPRWMKSWSFGTHGSVDKTRAEK